MALFTKLQPKPKQRDGGTCLLLDVSGSMSASVLRDDESAEGMDPRRIDILFKAVRDTPECAGLKAYAFSNSCYPMEVIPSESDSENFEPHGGTNLAEAFLFVKAAGFYTAILVTDGEPDSESSALNAAYGMKLGIIYVGNPPVPVFLERLAKATDGTFALADLRDIKQLESAIVHALPSPEDVPPPPAGVIKL